jgi:nicotinate-nucleotide adenylyltransferase
MVRLLLEQHGSSAELYFLMGLDSLADLPTWHKPLELMQQCNLVAFSRPDANFAWNALEAALPGVRSRVILLPMPELQISSSDLRERARQGRPLRYQVLPEVEQYIQQRHLYQRQWNGDEEQDAAG